MKKAMKWLPLCFLVLCSCIRRQANEPVADKGDALGSTVEASSNEVSSAEMSSSETSSSDASSIEASSVEASSDDQASNSDNWSDAEMPEAIAQTLPKTAVKRDEQGNMELYVNLDIEVSEDHPNQWSLWLRDKETGKVIFLIHTNNDAKPRWEEMTDANALEVPLEEIAAGDCDRAFLIPNAPGKVFVEGCPDGRNVWSYIYDINMQRIIQLPANEGFVDCDTEHKCIRLSHYRYYPEGGRYSVVKTFSYSGRFIGEEPFDPETGIL